MTQPLMALTARFDVNQVDDGIDWAFTDIESVGTINRTPGDPQWNRDIDFSAGQAFRIAVTATDHDNTNFESLEIVDCCIITLPQILCCGTGIRTWYCPPSLFVDNEGQQLGALYRLNPSSFSVHSTGVDPEKGRRVTLLWDEHLNVGKYNGSWELSFFLTVRIKRSGEKMEQLRVFYFDPETEVGNGTSPPRATP